MTPMATMTASVAKPLRMGVKVGVQGDAFAVAPNRFDRPGHAVLPEQPTGLSGELASLDDSAVGRRDLGAGGDVATGGHHAVVTEGDADTGVGAEQASLADGH